MVATAIIRINIAHTVCDSIWWMKRPDKWFHYVISIRLIFVSFCVVFVCFFLFCSVSVSSVVFIFFLFSCFWFVWLCFRGLSALSLKIQEWIWNAVGCSDCNCEHCYSLAVGSLSLAGVFLLIGIARRNAQHYQCNQQIIAHSVCYAFLGRFTIIGHYLIRCLCRFLSLTLTLHSVQIHSWAGVVCSFAL